MPEDKKDEGPAHLNTFIPGKLIKNPLSMVGLALAVVAFANIIFLILGDIISTNPNPYMGVLAYMVMPGFLILGLLLVVVGIVLERRRRVRGLSDASRFPKSTSTTRSVRGPTVIERRLCW
jgi:hypothetical protein